MGIKQGKGPVERKVELLPGLSGAAVQRTRIFAPVQCRQARSERFDRGLRGAPVGPELCERPKGVGRQVSRSHPQARACRERPLVHPLGAEGRSRSA